MRREEEDIQLIEDYLSGELDDKDRVKVESRMSEDDVFRQQTEDYKVLFAGIRLSGRKHMKQWLAELESGIEQDDKKTTSHRRLFPPSFYYIAASVAMIAVMFLFVFPKRADMEKVAAAYYEPYPATVYITKRSVEVVESDIEEAFQYYQAGDFDKSIQLFESLKENERTDITEFYLASAYQAKGNFDKAIVLYNNLIEKEGTFKSQSQWYMALCYLFKNDIEHSKVILKDLGKSTDSYGPKALKLLKDIKD